MIMFIIDIISWFLAIGIVIWIGLFTVKLIISKNKKNRNKELEKTVNSFEIGFKKVYSYFFFALGMLLKMFLAIMLAIGSKPIILKLNYPLGEGYAEFASYIMAIGLYMLLPDLWGWGYKKQKKEDN